MTNFARLLLTASLALLVCTGGCDRGVSATAGQARTAKAASSRKPAPDFSLQDASGKTVKLSDLRGKVVLLNFWATWCGPCALEIPWFKEFEQQYKSQGLEVIGVSMDEEGWTAVKPYMAQKQFNYRILLGNDSVGQLYGGIDSLPTTFLIDRQGRLAFPPHVGLIGKNDYLQEIRMLLHDEDSDTRRSQLARPPAMLGFAGILTGASAAQR